MRILCKGASIHPLFLGLLVACQGAPAKTSTGPSSARSESASRRGPTGSGGDRALDHDVDYADKADRVYLSGRGTDDAVDWEFLINEGRRKNEWAMIPVPSNWEFHGFGAFQYGFSSSSEVGTYRRAFEVPERWSRKQIFIVFEGSMTDTEVSINGTSAGPVHQGGFYRFEYDITRLVHPGENLVEVVVKKQSANASVNAAEREADYWTFGGIFRPVYLDAYPPQSIERFAIDARASGELGIDAYLRHLREDAIVTARVLDENLIPVGAPLSLEVAAGTKKVHLTGTFRAIEPWSAESPRRYRLALELETRSGTRHALRENFGFRTVEVRPGDGIYVNGKRVVLRGVNRHSFWPESGRALSAEHSRADIELMKEMNMNAVRSAHYPPDQHFLDRADALGLYVLDELAGWQSPPYDTEVGRRLIEEMVTFDVNHPSILFWNNGNEGGWNPELDADFARWDPQGRPVLHPWATFSNIDTDHYESFASTKSILSRGTLFMPTEFLHGLYDGGGGAGLDDYWRAISSSPVGAGGFLWAFTDEGVRRSPIWIDTAGNAAPDGILGPYREKEGSFHAVRQIWSPVQIPMNELTEGFDGSILVENRYDDTDLDRVRFAWQLVEFDFEDPDGGHLVIKEGTARTRSVPPHSKGTLELALPPRWDAADALLLDAYDGASRLVGRWSWMIQTPSELVAKRVDSPAASATNPLATETDASLTVTTGALAYQFAKSTGRLAGVSLDGKAFPLRNGPSLSVGDVILESFESEPEGDEYVVRATYTGPLEEVEWRVRRGGWLSLRYVYALRGSYPYFGVDFDCAESETLGVRWLGRGPDRVWKNRMRGPWHDLWARERNDAVTGARWEYPEFKGYFADVRWARFETTAGPFEVVMGSPDLFLRLFTPRNGANAQNASAAFPTRDVSFLHGIAPIGDKFLAPADLGPQGELHALDGTFEATLYLRFAPTPK